jgi:hypothetical protein
MIRVPATDDRQRGLLRVDVGLRDVVGARLLGRTPQGGPDVASVAWR